LPLPTKRKNRGRKKKGCPADEKGRGYEMDIEPLSFLREKEYEYTSLV